MEIKSKSLDHEDSSGFEFAKEMLDNNKTSAINFDRIQKHPLSGYIIFEYLLCEEKQFKMHNTTPYNSHPNKYWFKNKQKFIRLWELTKALNATLYLVNYAQKDTKYQNEILLIKVLEMNESGIIDQELRKLTRSEFKKFFRTLNTECLGYIPCKNCGSPLIAKKGVNGRDDFLGCSDYKTSGCKYTEKIKKRLEV